MIASAMGFNIPIQASLLVIFTCLAMLVLASLNYRKETCAEKLSRCKRPGNKQQHGSGHYGQHKKK